MRYVLSLLVLWATFRTVAVGCTNLSDMIIVKDDKAKVVVFMVDGRADAIVDNVMSCAAMVAL